MSEMTVKKGRGVSEGIAIGAMFYFESNTHRPNHKKIKDTSKELKRFEAARVKAINELGEIYDRTLYINGNPGAEIFMAQSMILSDEDYISRIRSYIMSENRNAEWAVSEATRFFYEIFSGVEDESIRAKAIDLKDVANKLIVHLSGTKEQVTLSEPCIVAAADITPSELMSLNKDMVLGLVLREGSAYSHTVILAKTMGIPVLVGIRSCKDWNSRNAIIDGINGRLILEPSNDTINDYIALIENRKSEQFDLLKYRGQATFTKSGKRLEILCNSGGVEDTKEAAVNDADGIGLLRTEFIFLERETLPTALEHYEIYSKIIKEMNGKPIVIRTMDIGADKKIKALPMAKEDNPALGNRAIRLCLSNEKLFIEQLKGIQRAAVHGQVSILYPMITSVDEIRQVKKLFDKAKEELLSEGILVPDIKQGIMIETPAAAIISDELAKEVDFFSIGTNDLTQYALAVDRHNSNLENYYNPYHEAVFRMIRMTVDNAHNNNIQVTVCGELAGDLRAVERLIDMGVDALSVAPKQVLRIRKVISEIR